MRLRPHPSMLAGAAFGTVARASIVPFRHQNGPVEPFARCRSAAMLRAVNPPDAKAELELGTSARRLDPTTATEDLQTALSSGTSQRPPRPVRILVVDDHEGFRSSMVQALDLIPDVEVAGEARSGDEACNIVLTLKPDVVLLDLSMPGMDAMDATRQIRRVNPSSQVVVLSAFDGPQIEQAALAAGAWGLVPKGTPLVDVVGVLLNAAEQQPSR